MSAEVGRQGKSSGLSAVVAVGSSSGNWRRRTAWWTGRRGRTHFDWCMAAGCKWGSCMSSLAHSGNSAIRISAAGRLGTVGTDTVGTVEPTRFGLVPGKGDWLQGSSLIIPFSRCELRPNLQNLQIADDVLTAKYDE